MLRYLSSEYKKDKEKVVKVKLISGERLLSHVVILLDERIIDSNLTEIILKE